MPDFNSPRLTESSIQTVVTFLVRCLKPATDLETFDDLHLATFNYSIALRLEFKRTACTSPNARNIFIEHTIKYSCGFKDHLEMPLGQWMLRLTVSKEGNTYMST